MTAPEPDLTVGDAGEWVALLRSRLHTLGLLDLPGDTTFDETTADAVRRFQELQGLPATGEVRAETWAALIVAEDAAGLLAPAAPQFADPPAGTLSEDRQWRWDGERWEPVDEPAVASSSDVGGGQLSADGQWVWDGAHWQPAS